MPIKSDIVGGNLPDTNIYKYRIYMKKSELKALIREVVQEMGRLPADTFPKLTDLDSGKVYKRGDEVHVSYSPGTGHRATVLAIDPVQELVQVRYLDGPAKGKRDIIGPVAINAEFR